LIAELNKLLVSEKPEEALKKLSPSSRHCFDSLPESIQKQLLLDRDPHGNVQVSKIETERLFIETVKNALKARQFKGKFSAQPLFCGYEGRSAFPSNFDAHYCYALGHVAALLIENGATGYMSLIQDLHLPVEQWSIAAAPLVGMMDLEERKGEMKPVIKKALVDLQGKPFNLFKEEREEWMVNDHYRYPGPIQFWGPKEIAEAITITLYLR
jgi:pyrophosphate--fructose-6-phosphate 1-phosphotransferase